MPRIIFLFMVAACAGCAGGHRLAQTPRADAASLGSRLATSKKTALAPGLRPVTTGKLTAFEPAPCVGERHDDNLIEEEVNQPWLRPINR